MKKKKRQVSLQQIKDLRKKQPLICKNCKLYDSKNGVCSVVILDKGQKLELKTKPTDPCMWDAMGIEVHRMRAWSDGKNGYVEHTQEQDKESE